MHARGTFWEDQAACGDIISRHKEYIRSDTYDIIYNYDPKMVIVAASKHTGLAQAPPNYPICYIPKLSLYISYCNTVQNVLSH